MFCEGQQIGLYTLIRKLGRGGFGEVWLAERKSKFVTTKVAVKLPLDDQIDHEAIKQEAQLWEQASGHPNILPIIDADEYDGQIVIVSEYAPDGSLDEWLKTHGKMPIEKAVEMTIQILNGLEFLHSRNIIHRDLKPANILLQGETPRLADFGISRALRTTASSQSSNVSGTFAYMPPEGFDGKRSVQTDIWSVGVNLYQFLTGNLPYPQKEPSALIAAIMMKEFEPLTSDIPQNLKNVIAKALAKLPENRYKTAKEMRDELSRVLRGEALTNFVQSDSQQNYSASEILPTQKVAPNFTQNFQDESETIVRAVMSVGQSEKRQSSNTWRYAIIMLFAFIVICFGTYFFINQSKQVDSNKNEVAKVSATQPSNNFAKLENSNVNPDSNLSSPKPIPTPDKAQFQTVVNKYVAGVAKVQDFREFKESKELRKTYYGDIDNDDDEDAVVVSVLTPKDGGNAYVEVLSVYRNIDGKFSAVTDTKIGSGGFRDAKFKTIKDGQIYFDLMIYDPDKDSRCCPSIKGKTSYILSNDKLVEK